MSPPVPEILLVEDDEAVRQSLASGLRDHVFAVREAASAAEARAVYRQRHRSITLVVLAEQLGRRRALVALQGTNPAVRSCLLSDGDVAGELLGRGAVLVIPKPLPAWGKSASSSGQRVYRGAPKRAPGAAHPPGGGGGAPPTSGPVRSEPKFGPKPGPSPILPSGYTGAGRPARRRSP
jgi:CheY-like chemotaxis protein